VRKKKIIRRRKRFKKTSPEKIFFLAILLSLVFFGSPTGDIPKSQKGHMTLGSEGFPYGARTSECLHPKFSHLCTDYSGSSYLTSNNLVVVTCDDNCGNIYSFRKDLLLTNRNQEDWQVTTGGDNTEDLKILQRGMDTRRKTAIWIKPYRTSRI
jgi:hypothetical protein